MPTNDYYAISAREHRVGCLIRRILKQGNEDKIIEEIKGERDWAVITYKGKKYKIQIYEVEE